MLSTSEAVYLSVSLARFASLTYRFPLDLAIWTLLSFPRLIQQLLETRTPVAALCLIQQLLDAWQVQLPSCFCSIVGRRCFDELLSLSTVEKLLMVLRCEHLAFGKREFSASYLMTSSWTLVLLWKFLELAH
jgi:hypothetical protein